MTPLVAVNFEINSKKIPEPFLICTVVGESDIAKKIYKRCPITVLHKIMLEDLIELDMVDFVLILSMDWFHSYYPSIDYVTQVVKFQFTDEPVFEWSGNSMSPKIHFISYLKARKLISKDCIYHLV